MSVPEAWYKGDDYHIRSQCGRYTVARVSGARGDSYVAWRRYPDHDDEPTKPAIELGSVVVRPNASDAERIEARKAMQQRCAEHAQGELP